MPLPAAFKFERRTSIRFPMFSGSALYTLTPQFKTGWLHLSAHKFNDLLFANSKLNLNDIKWSSVFPGHLYDAICRSNIKCESLRELATKLVEGQ